MKKLLYIVSFLIICIVTSCNKSHYSFDVKEIDYVNQSDTMIDGTMLDFELPLGVYNFTLCDSFFIFLTEDPSGQLLVYSKEWSFLGSYCSKGRAKNEIISPSFLSRQVFIDEGGTVSIPLIEQRARIKVIDVTQSIKMQRTIVSNQRDCNSIYYLLLDDDINSTLEFFTPTYDRYYADVIETPYFEIKRMGSEKGKRIELYPKVMNLEDMMDATYFYMGGLYKHPTRNMVIQPLYYMDYIIFLDIDNKKYFGIHQTGSLSFDDRITAVQDVETEDDYYLLHEGKVLDYHYKDVFCSDSFFMVLYCAGDYSLNVEDPSLSKPELLLFDWEGNLLRSMKLAKRINSIIYDANTSTLYGLDRNEGHLYSFDLADVIANLNY